MYVCIHVSMPSSLWWQQSHSLHPTSRATSRPPERHHLYTMPLQLNERAFRLCSTCSGCKPFLMCEPSHPRTVNFHPCPVLRLLKFNSTPLGGHYCICLLSILMQLIHHLTIIDIHSILSKFTTTSSGIGDGSNRAFFELLQTSTWSPCKENTMWRLQPVQWTWYDDGLDICRHGDGSVPLAPSFMSIHGVSCFVLVSRVQPRVTLQSMLNRFTTKRMCPNKNGSIDGWGIFSLDYCELML